jgi:NAD(P)-dependent dehydrogenase (short-subunit alcohol dehydrogenase family)
MAKGWSEKEIPDLSGRVAIVTGANSGLGYETALQLAGHGARTILACRDPGRASGAVERIRARFPQSNVEALALDLSSLASVRGFAQTFQAKYSRLDILINNAGVMAIPRKLTADGLEMQLGTNYLGHFALTGLLLDRLIASKAGRVVSLGSVAAWFGRMRFDDLQGVKSYSNWAAYCQSKLANLIFAQELQRRLANRGLPVRSIACHPGYSATNLQVASSNVAGSVIGKWIYTVGNGLFGMSPARGALTEVRAATDPELRGGEYIGPRGLLELWGLPTHVKLPQRASDEVAGRRLWESSEELTNVRYEAFARAA